MEGWHQSLWTYTQFTHVWHSLVAVGTLVRRSSADANAATRLVPRFHSPLHLTQNDPSIMSTADHRELTSAYKRETGVTIKLQSRPGYFPVCCRAGRVPETLANLDSTVWRYFSVDVAEGLTPWTYHVSMAVFIILFTTQWTIESLVAYAQGDGPGWKVAGSAIATLLVLCGYVYTLSQQVIKMNDIAEQSVAQWRDRFAAQGWDVEFVREHAGWKSLWYANYFVFTPNGGKPSAVSV